MSEETVKAFIEKLGSDKTLLKQIARADSNKVRLQLAKEAGFELSTEELTRVIDQFTSEELSENELDAVAGGRGYLKGEIIPKKPSSRWKIGVDHKIVA